MSDPSETFDWIGEAYKRLEEAEAKSKQIRSGTWTSNSVAILLRKLASSISKVEVMRAQGKEVPDMLSTLLSEEIENLANLAFHHLSIQRRRTEPTTPRQ